METGFTGSDAFVVPTGFVCVVRDLDAYAGNSGVSPIHLRLLNALGGTIRLFQVDPDTNASFQWTGRQVFNAGEDVTVLTDAPWDFAVSGYLLSLP